LYLLKFSSNIYKSK